MVKVKHSHGLTETYDDYGLAITALERIYGDKIETEGDLEHGIVLVWRDRESSLDDDGARSVARIWEIYC